MIDSLTPQSTENIVKKSLLLSWLICTLGAVFYCYEYFLRISPSVMTQELMRTYHLTGAQVGNLSAFYYHAYVPMQILVGLLMDRYGPRRLLTMASLFCALGTFLFADSNNILVSEAGRFLVGFGSAFAFVGAMKLATIWLPPKRFALIAGIIVCLGMIGAMCGDILLGALVDKIGWQMTTDLSGILGIGLAIIIWLVVRDINVHSEFPEVHIVSFRTVMSGLVRAIMNPQIWLNGCIGMLLYLSLSAFAELWGVRYLQEAYGFSRATAANANSMVFLGWAIGSPLWGWFSDYIHKRILPILVSAILALIMICIVLYLPHTSVIGVSIELFLFGLFCSAQILIFAICREISSLKIVGTAIALTNMMVMIGGNIFQPVIGKLLDVRWDGTIVAGVRIYTEHAYRVALSVLPLSMILTVIVALFLRETYCKVREDHFHN
ncbi:hypothetical protein AYO45_00770 [Gammaproteobacteria bacterium SCGC AG-212-F23]|nr:hypothetical protein AYO45_00770 [Gammaproteobacteria bacterium SCGC AG-212-F23]